MITGQAGQGISVYGYWTRWARDICVWLLDKGCVCMITGQDGQGLSVYGYWTIDVYV